MHVVLRKKQSLLLVVLGDSCRDCLLWFQPRASVWIRRPNAEDERGAAGMRVPAGEGPLSAVGLLGFFIYEERQSIMQQRLPCGPGPAVSAVFGRTLASISIKNLIKTDLWQVWIPGRGCVCGCVRTSRIPASNSHCCYRLGVTHWP